MPARSITRRSHHMLVAAVAVVAVASSAFAQDRNYIGANNGVWSLATDWSPNDVPDTVAENALITNGATVVVNGFFTIGALTVNVNNGVSIINANGLSLNANVTNSGLITLNGTNNVTEFRLGSSLSLLGSGELRLAATANSSGINVVGASAASSNFTLTNSASHTIRGLGLGSVGRNTTGLNNAGLIVADSLASNLVVDASALGLTNTGTLRATNNGLLNLNDSVITNTNGTIEGVLGGTVVLTTANITGGTLAGTLRVDSSATINSLSNTGTISLNNNTSLSTTGTINNTGAIVLNGTNNVTELRMTGNTTFTGAGEIRLSNTANSTGINVVGGVAAADGFTLTNGVGHTIRAQGLGNLGRNTTALINNGLITGEGSSSSVFTIDAAAAGGLTNTGTIQATSGRTSIIGSVVTNTGGTITSSGTGVIGLDNGAQITGGTVSGTVNNTGTNRYTTLTHSAATTLTNASVLELLGTITNSGSFSLTGTNNVTELRLAGDTTFAGSGSVQLTATANSDGIDVVGASALADGFRLTNNSGHTLRATGLGSVGRNTTLLSNAGLVTADTSTASLLVDLGEVTGAQNTNTGRFSATNAGLLTISGTTLNNAGGTIGTDANAASLVRYTNSSITSGSLDGNGAIAGTSTFTNLTTTAAINIPNAQTLQTSGTITNNGSITLSGTNNVTELRMAADTTLAGSGVVQFVATANADGISVVGASALASGFRLTNNSGHTVRATGLGSLGRNTTLLSNAGLVNADTSAASLIVDLGEVAGQQNFNTGRFSATNAGLLTISGTTLNNAGGTIGTDANAASLVRYTNSSITSGSLDGNGAIAGTSTFTNLTTTAAINIPNAQTLQTSGTITNNGSITLSGTNNVTELRPIADTTLAGTGEVLLNSTANASGIDVIGASSATSNLTLTNGTGHTIRAIGQGTLGRNTTAIVNNGNIVSDAQDGGSFTFIVDPAATLVNNGTLRATRNGDLALFDGSYTNNGTIEALATSGITVPTAGFVLTNYNASTSTLTGGTYRAINGNLFLDGNNTIDLAVNSATIELSGNSNATNLFASSQGGGRSNSNAFRSNTGTLLLNDGAEIVTTLANGGFSNSGDLLVGTDAIFTVQGTGGGVLSNTARLRGEGTIVATSVTNSGIIAPGLAASGPLVPDAGLLTLLAPLSLTNASQLLIELGGTTSGSTFDVLSVNSVSLDGQLVVSLFNGFMPSSTDTFTVVDSAITSLTGTFAGVANGSMQTTVDGSYTYTVNYTGGDVVLSNFTAVPEPTSLMLLGSAGLLLKRRRR